MNICIITGASSGLGRAFFEALADVASIDAFYLLGRDEARLSALAACTQKPVYICPFDLTDHTQRGHFINELRASGARVQVLVSSAGFGIIGPAAEGNVAEQIDMVRLNCEALTDLTLSLRPQMGAGTRVFHIASVAAFLPQTYFAVYAATKAYVLSFSEALATEWRREGIRVTAVCPNPMDTRFFDRAGSKRGGRFKAIGFETPEKVAATALSAADHGRTVSVSHPAGRALRLLARLLPHRLVTVVEKYIF